MIEQLNELVRESGQEVVVNNPAVPNEQNEAVMQEASTSIFSGMQDMMQQGGPAALKSLFEGVQNNDQSNPAVQQVSNQVSGNLVNKFGLDSGAAKGVAASLIPVVLGKLMNRSRNAEGNSGFSIENILGSLMGGGSQNVNAQVEGQPLGTAGGGILGKLSSLGARLGLDKDGDGDTDLRDLVAMFRR